MVMLAGAVNVGTVLSTFLVIAGDSPQAANVLVVVAGFVPQAASVT